MDKAPITLWISQARSGDQEAVQGLWSFYGKQLQNLAAYLLRNSNRRGADESDHAQRVFFTFWRRAVDGQFPELEDRDGLWCLLRTISVRKAINTRKHERRRLPVGSSENVLSRIPDRGSLEFETNLNDTLDFLVRKYNEPLLRTVTVLRLQRYSLKEIARMVDRSVPTVERKLRRVREILEAELRI